MTRAGGGGERSDSPGSLARPESQVVTDSDHELEGNEPNVGAESVGPTVVPDENKSVWEFPVSAPAEVLLRIARDSANAFGPLKSVSGCLHSILEHCEVRFPPI